MMRVFLAAPDSGYPGEIAAALIAAIEDAKHDRLADVAAAHAGLQKSERERFLATVDRMMEADMLVADVSEPDAGVGWCVAWFLARGRLAVLSCRKDARGSLAAMLAGNPSPWQRVVTYDRAESLAAELAKALR